MTGHIYNVKLLKLSILSRLEDLKNIRSDEKSKIHLHSFIGLRDEGQAAKLNEVVHCPVER